MPQQMIMAAIPGFFDIADAVLAAGQPLSDDILLKLNHNAKFGCVRCEYIFMGYFQNGATVGVPVSPVDGYPYSQAEVTYDWRRASTRAPGAGFIDGQAEPPVISASQPANLYYWNDDINDATGVVALLTSYYNPGGAETVTNDGIVKVYAICQRASANVSS